MARPRYQLTDDDVTVAHRWIRDKFRSAGVDWPKEYGSATAYEKFPLENPTAKKLQAWCDRWLNAKQWQQLQAAIRSARRDRQGNTRSISVSNKAHEILSTIGKREQLTFSEVIEKYLAVKAIPPPMLLPQPLPERICPYTGAVKLHSMRVGVYLLVENNSKFVRGKKKAREDIERYVLSAYGMKKTTKDRWDYVLTIPYDTDTELDRIIDEIIMGADREADSRHCFIEIDVVSLDDPERMWG